VQIDRQLIANMQPHRLAVVRLAEHFLRHASSIGRSPDPPHGRP
jgi:hypothetical protein